MVTKHHITGAHYGLRDWIMQRATAVVMVVYTVMLLALLLQMPTSYVEWREFFEMTWVRIVTQVTVFALLLHVWVGIRDVWMDYVKPVGLRLTLHILTILWLVGSLVYSVKVLWGL